MLLTARYVLPVAAPHIENGAVLVHDDGSSRSASRGAQGGPSGRGGPRLRLRASCRASSTCTRISSSPACVGSSTTCPTPSGRSSSWDGGAPRRGGLGEPRVLGALEALSPASRRSPTSPTRVRPRGRSPTPACAASSIARSRRWRRQPSTTSCRGDSRTSQRGSGLDGDGRMTVGLSPSLAVQLPPGAVLARGRKRPSPTICP